MVKRLALAPLILTAIALIAAACGGGDGDEPVSAGPSLGVGPGLSVSEALDSRLDQLLLVNGILVVKGDEARLCELLLESFPPQCGGASLLVIGLDLSTVDGLQREGDVQWTNGTVQLLGPVEDGVLTVSSTVQG